MLDKKQLREQVKLLQPVGGQKMRHALLAYAYARGVPYYRVELTTREDNKPKLAQILSTLSPEECKSFEDVNEFEELVKSVTTWLSQPADIEYEARVQTARLQYIDDKRRRGQEWADHRRALLAHPKGKRRVLRGLVAWLFS